MKAEVRVALPGAKEHQRFLATDARGRPSTSSLTALEGSNAAHTLTSRLWENNSPAEAPQCVALGYGSPGKWTRLWMKNPRICKQGPLIMNGRVWAPTWTWGSFPQVSQSTLCLHHYEYKSSLFMIKCKNVMYLRCPPLDISGSPQVFNKLTSSPRSRGLVGRTVVHRTVSAYASLTAIFPGAPLMA